MKHVTEKIVEWLKQQVGETGAQGAVVAISGGLDSAVAAGVAQQAFPHSSLGVIMPCHSDRQDVIDARAVAEAIGMKHVTIDLSTAWNTLVESVSQSMPELTQIGNEALAPSGGGSLAGVNIKPRLRMTTLYAIAQQLGYVVVGGENLVELAIGYFTKYGDGGADFFPLGSLVKREVRQVGEVLGIPRQVLDRVPTAGLWAGQTDEAELGLTYDVLDQYILTGEASPLNKNKIDKMIAGSEHKRQLPPSPARELLFV